MIDAQQVQNKQAGRIYKPLYVKEYTTVVKALVDGSLQSDSELLIIRVGSEHLAFSKQLMAYHHIAEGYLDGRPYMVTFCVVCNSGMVMNPEVDGKMHHFYAAGVYDGMLLMADRETDTYWHHVTGEGLLGKHEHDHLKILQPHQVLLTREVIAQYPDCKYGIPKVNVLQKSFAKFQNWKARTSGKGFLPPGFRQSMSNIDSRLDEMEMGIGVWVGDKSKFYPISVLEENGNFMFDQFDDRVLLLYISPTTHTPSALFVNKITTVDFSKDRLVFEDGNYLLSSNLYTKEGEELSSSGPWYIFSRWYGFVVTFPKCEVMQ